MALTMKEIAEIQCFKIGVCCTHTPCSVYQEENLIRGLLCPSGRAIPEMTCISFDFDKVSQVFTNSIFTSYPSATKKHLIYRVYIICS